jgi:hypothetical protein
MFHFETSREMLGKFQSTLCSAVVRFFLNPFGWSATL